MKKYYAIIGLFCFIAFMYKFFNINNIRDLGMLILWGVAMIINQINYYHAEDKKA
jgi:hypothetical protein